MSRAPWGWTDAHRAQRVAILGATGAVGAELAQILVDAGHPRERIACHARSDGTMKLRGTELSVRAMPPSPRDLAENQLVFLCTPTEVSLELAPRLCELGHTVVDSSSAFRENRDVPLVIPEINGRELAAGPRLVANPNCTATVACLPLAVVARLAGLEEVLVCSYQAASGAGAAGLDALRRELRYDNGLPPEEGPQRPTPFPATLAQNVIPAVATVGSDGWSGEERKITNETRRILGLPSLVVESTTVRVPVERCHSVAVHLKTRDRLAPETLVAALREAPGVIWVDDVHGPRPRECAGRDEIFVGRVRAGARGDRSLAFFAVGDQIRKGAALNAVQIAAGLPARSAVTRGAG
jgi:aspartate-semialdehyde dehydrogenase